jgi:hypothetical protein
MIGSPQETMLPPDSHAQAALPGKQRAVSPAMGDDARQDWRRAGWCVRVVFWCLYENE